MRIKLPEPKSYCFSTTLKVRVSDLNYADHLSNDKLLTYAHQARVELFASWGQSELNFGGMGIIMTDAAVIFKAEGHLNDELIIWVGVDDISRLGFDLYYRVVNQQTGQEIALMKTGIVCFDYSSKKVVPIPALVVDILQKL